MLLAVDIGNTNIVLGGIQGHKIVLEVRIATDRNKTSDEYAIEILKVLRLHSIHAQDIEDCILSSVVPPVMNAVRTGLIKIIGRQPLVVGPGVKTGLNIRMDNPASVGSDRIVIAVGALAQYQPPLILLDFGTATTLEVINRQGAYIGGCIIPGVKTALDGLITKTAQLPNISLEVPRKMIGKNTEDCIRSGVLYGTAAMIDGMVDRAETELGEKATVIATGGLAPLIMPLCRRKIPVEQDLLLKGLNLIYRKNARNR